MNGSPVLQGSRNTSGTFGPLTPETSYTFSVQARDFGGNSSPVSDPVTVTTEASDTNDTEPPTTPGNLRDNGMSFQDGETWLFWDQSTDNVDPQLVIRYDVYVNGVFDHSLQGYGQTVVYGNAEAENTFQVIAVDSAGNQSAPATLTTCAVVFC
jgi:chitodextrinase